MASFAQGSMHGDVERPQLAASDPLAHLVEVLPES